MYVDFLFKNLEKIYLDFKTMKTTTTTVMYRSLLAIVIYYDKICELIVCFVLKYARQQPGCVIWA